MDIDALVQEKIEADAEFQGTLATLPEEEREAALSTKRKEVMEGEFASLKEKADAAAKAEELANNYKIRAEKAELAAKSKTGDGEPAAQHSTADIIALSKVHEDDIERVEKFAKDEGVSIREALRNEELTAILAVREEKRSTAQASNVSNVRRGAVKQTNESILSSARDGKLPESDADIARLMEAKAEQARKG